MNLILSALLGVACLTALPASADVSVHLDETFQSGARFSGNLTFTDHFNNLLGVDGVLTGTVDGPLTFSWTYNRYNNGGVAASFDDNPATYEDWLMNGTPPDGWTDLIGLSWVHGADTLQLVLDPNLSYYTGLNGDDAAVSAVTSPVPEASTWAMLGVGLAGLACLKRRQTKA